MLVDTNAIIEAVRVGCWAAITGAMNVATVSACCAEALAGDSAAGYVPVTKADLRRLRQEHTVSEGERAALYLQYEQGDGMDVGERDLFAHMCAYPDIRYLICSPDKASVRAAMHLGWGDRLCALGDLAVQVGCRPNPALQAHFEGAWLSSARTQFILGTL